MSSKAQDSAVACGMIRQKHDAREASMLQKGFEQGEDIPKYEMKKAIKLKYLTWWNEQTSTNVFFLA